MLVCVSKKKHFQVCQSPYTCSKLKNSYDKKQKYLITKLKSIWMMLFKQCKPYLSCIMTKPTKWPVRQAKPQISLGIRPVWSESSLSAWRNLGSYATNWAHYEDSDQTGRMPRLIWVFAWRTDHFVGFVMRRLICLLVAQIKLQQWSHSTALT